MSLAPFKELSPEVLAAGPGLCQIDRGQLADLKIRADRSPRRRARICAHRSPDDRLHEMLIVLARDVYIRPHRHLGKTESFHVIEGTATVVFFDDHGGILEVVEVGDYASGRRFFFRSDDLRYHTQIVTSDHLVFHETTGGPFRPEDTVYASWAPPDTDPAAATAFRENLRRTLAARGNAG